MKIVINKCYGGFGVSDAAYARYRLEKGITDVDHRDYYIERNDPVLVSIVEDMGEDSFGDYAELKVVEIPDDVEYLIHDYDGQETIHEQHRVWF